MTKPDKIGHSKALALRGPAKGKQEVGTLPPSQAAAVEVFAMGKGDSEAAKAAGVTRQTVNGWRNHDIDFIAEVNRRRLELWTETHDRLRGLSLKALDVMEEALNSYLKISLPAALSLLKCFKLYGTLEGPGGPTTPEEILRGQALQRANARLAEMSPDDPLDSILFQEENRPRLVREEFAKLQAERELSRRRALPLGAQEGRSGKGGDQ